MPALIAMLAMIGAGIAWVIRRARRPATEGAGRFEETPEEEARG